MSIELINTKDPVILCDDDKKYDGWDNIIKQAERKIVEQQDEYIKNISLEIIKKANIKGNSEDIANEFIKIYHTLKDKINGTNTRNIPTQTVFDDYIICLEDGKKMQMLNRHLKVKYHMSFQDYKKKWGLPIDYPCTCKNYSKIRADIAKKRKHTNNSNNNPE